MSSLVSLILILLLMPVWLMIALVQLVVFKNIFFYQVRIGKAKKAFQLYKFKSLICDSYYAKSEQDHSGWGDFLRSTSLDELPQLVNILKGDMNFIGPRPLLPEYLPLYNSQQIRRHDVKPRLAGWAQVQGRSNLSWHEQFELDVWYVNNRTFWLDLKILYLTFFKVFKPSKGETQQREAFNGSN
jgi:lipopolysaccharide/colanic/teichoic acid biosynthesis glycosyltransferase